jgi:hypothetical protein
MVAALGVEARAGADLGESMEDAAVEEAESPRTAVLPGPPVSFSKARWAPAPAEAGSK